MRNRSGRIVGLVLLTVGGLFVGSLFLLSALMGAIPDDSTDDCGAAAPVDASIARGVGDLTPAQLTNAQAVVAEGRRMNVPLQGIVIALATASQESHFTNYANDGRGGDLAFFQRGIGRSLALPHEAVGTDHGSLGIFQQQWPWWGTMAQLMGPARAAGKFYAALVKGPPWPTKPGTVAAQAGQTPPVPGAYAHDQAPAPQPPR